MSTPSPARRRPLAIAAVLIPGAALAAWYVVQGYRLTGTSGFPLDDSWIHAQFARNIAIGRGFTYTGGEWVSGSTAPAWTLLLAGGYFIARNIVRAAFALGLICQAFASYYALRMSELLGAPTLVAAFAGIVVGVTPVVVWGAASGMEVTLAAALVLAGLYHHFRAREDSGPTRYVGAVLLGVSVLARPENLAIAGVVGFAELLGRAPAPARLRRAAQVLVVTGVVFLPLVAFSYTTIRRPLPTTFYAKSGPGIVRALETADMAMAERALLTFGPRAVDNFRLTLEDQLTVGAGLLLPAALAGVIVRSSRSITLTIAAIYVLVPFAMGITAPQRLKPENVRYTAQLVVLAPPLIAAGLAQVSRRRLTLSVALVAVLAGVTGWRTVERAREYAIAVKNIQELHVTTGRWIAAHLPSEAVIAANDVGALAYFGERRILDLEGLVSPEVLPYRRYVDRGIRVVSDMRPDYVVIFPEWYPEIPKSPGFTEIHRVTIRDNVVSAGATLVVYETPWTRR